MIGGLRPPKRWPGASKLVHIGLGLMGCYFRGVWDVVARLACVSLVVYSEFRYYFRSYHAHPTTERQQSMPFGQDTRDTCCLRPALKYSAAKHFHGRVSRVKWSCANRECCFQVRNTPFNTPRMKMGRSGQDDPSIVRLSAFTIFTAILLWK